MFTVLRPKSETRQPSLRGAAGYTGPRRENLGGVFDSAPYFRPPIASDVVLEVDFVIVGDLVRTLLTSWTAQIVALETWVHGSGRRLAQNLGRAGCGSSKGDWAGSSRSTMFTCGEAFTLTSAPSLLSMRGQVVRR